ncbi:hypothetical protein LCGC14_2448650 [marine sediment metagenome]|uniref:Uncharacterized protein n=1 Tax=marine sediment metagenome TaxID=412755 RepID=A0A0F9EAM6_9ZZZZ
MDKEPPTIELLQEYCKEQCMGDCKDEDTGNCKVRQYNAAREKPCVWKWNKRHNRWDTGCGQIYWMHGKDLKNVKTCLYCGQPIQEGE